jgi:light-regulated signal transduction histidine kinase (bacteriophytochrome)
LKEPLRKIISYADLLATRYKERLDPIADRYLETIAQSGLRMRALIDDLLAFSHLSKADVPMEPVSLAVAAKNAVSDLEALIKETGAQIDIGPLPTARARPLQMHQLFQNLIGNAVKYHGERPPRVTVGMERRGMDTVIAVRDNGIGIDAAYRERIFNVFARLHGRDEYGGTGIGLAICKKIVEAHGGRIWVEQNPGGGSVFLFTVPAVAAEMNGVNVA